MFIRQFSLRSLLTVVTACAGISLIFSFALREHLWAIAMGACVAALAAQLAVQALLFWVVWLLGQIANVRRRRSSARAIVNPASAQSIAAES